MRAGHAAAAAALAFVWSLPATGQSVSGSLLLSPDAPVSSASDLNAFPTWTFGVSISYPFGTSGADASMARALAERRHDAEQQKFNAGTSTSFLVFQAQRDLAAARNNELRAILDYNRSLVDFEAVQQTALGAGGGVATPQRGGSGN